MRSPGSPARTRSGSKHCRPVYRTAGSSSRLQSRPSSASLPSAHVIGEDTVVVVVPKTALDAGLRSDLLASHRRPAETIVDELAQPPPPIEDGPLWPPPPPLQEEPAAEDRRLREAPAAYEPPAAYQPPAAYAPPAAEEPPAADPEPQFLAPVSALPVVRQTDADADAVVALANEARAMAERLAAGAAAVTAQAHQSEAYEARIAALERQLAERTGQLAQVREQLEARRFARSPADHPHGGVPEPVPRRY